MRHDEIVATYKELTAGLGIPVAAGQCVILPDWNDLGHLLAEARMHELFVRSLPEDQQPIASRTIRRCYTGKVDRQVVLGRHAKGFGVIDPSDVSELRISLTVEDSVSVEGRFPVYWHWICGVRFLRNLDTGAVLGQWGEVYFQLFSPLGASADPPAVLVDELLGFLVDAAVLSGALGGGVAWTQMGLGTYYLHPRGEPVEPERLDAVRWVTLLGPRLTERLGGVESIAASRVFHEVRSVHYRDGRAGVLVRICDRASDFDDGDPSVLNFLRPVLASP